MMMVGGRGVLTLLDCQENPLSRDLNRFSSEQKVARSTFRARGSLDRFPKAQEVVQVFLDKRVLSEPLIGRRKVPFSAGKQLEAWMIPPGPPDVVVQSFHNRRI